VDVERFVTRDDRIVTPTDEAKAERIITQTAALRRVRVRVRLSALASGDGFQCLG
jgi:hypothetical protein